MPEFPRYVSKVRTEKKKKKKKSIHGKDKLNEEFACVARIKKKY